MKSGRPSFSILISATMAGSGADEQQDDDKQKEQKDSAAGERVGWLSFSLPMIYFPGGAAADVDQLLWPLRRITLSLSLSLSLMPFAQRAFIASRYSAISAPPAILFLGAQIFLIIRGAHPAKGEFLRQPTRGISIKKTRAIYCRRAWRRAPRIE
jgi:hypothetical protein